MQEIINLRPGNSLNMLFIPDTTMFRMVIPNQAPRDDAGIENGHFDLKRKRLKSGNGQEPFLFFDFLSFVLCFGNIKVGKHLSSSFVHPDRQGFWLQHNPKNNLLTLLAVSRQVYDEARRVLYSLNSFIFEVADQIPVFLIGIGRENAAFLQSVRWMNGPRHAENQIDSIRQCLTRSEEEHIWNDEKSYLSLFAMLVNKPLDYVIAHHNHHLVRLDSEYVPSRGYRVRYRMQAILGETDGEVIETMGTEGTISFEVYKCPREYDFNTYQYIIDSK
ncbi:hypothetical protein APSETT445_002353 [Aspergillus pseudonomiae]